MRDYVAMYLCIENDFCLEESIVALKSQGLKDAYIFHPKRYWSSGELAQEKAMTELASIAVKTSSMLVPMDEPKETVEPIQIEGWMRNYALRFLRDRGWSDILIIDGDELWMPGTLEEVDNLLKPSPAKINLHLIAVAGMPGYPITSKGGEALVYVPTGVNISWGRSCGTGVVPSRTCNRSGLHFSMVRKTMEQLLKKCRLSAHYKQPGYDFEWWIKDVLPNIKPGATDVHCYRAPTNIWPLVREWTAEEWALIPETLKPYLGACK